MIRVAAVADVHFGEDSKGTLRPHLERLADDADVLLVAGDLTRHGTPEEVSVLADELDIAGVPVVAVLGNHDHHSDRADEIRTRLTDAGVTTLEGDSTILETPGGTLGIAGAKGFGGGFVGACATEFGEPEIKAFVRHTKQIAEALRGALGSLNTEARVALLHYAPVEDTLRGERPEIYPFLGSYLLAEAIDGAGADLVLHGHAHNGAEKGITPGGIHVRNVAQPVIGSAYKVFRILNSSA